MTSVDELLATMAAPTQSRVILTVDEDLRIISIPSLAIVIGAQGDRNVNRIYFKMNRYYRGTDLSGFSVRVNYVNAAGKNYYYDSSDLHIEGDELVFSWLVRQTAAEAVGTVTFSLCMRRCEDGELAAEFNTTTASMNCLKSIHDSSAMDDGGDTVENISIAVLGRAIVGQAVVGNG